MWNIIQDEIRIGFFQEREDAIRALPLCRNGGYIKEG